MTDLTALFAPRGVAFVGVSEDMRKYGGRVLRYCLDGGYTGGVFPVNPKYDTVLGRRCFPSLEAVEGAFDLVMVMVAPERVEAVLAAARGRARAAIVTGDMVPKDAPGREARLAALKRGCRAAGLRLVGPQCMGVVSPGDRLAVSTSSALPLGLPKPGHVALATQSGGVLGGVMDRARSAGIGFSRMVSCGEGFDLGICDFLEHFLADGETRAVALYAEWIEDWPRFLALGARARAAGKPVVLLKPGYSAAGQEAALSHTGRIAGNRAVHERVLARHGILLANDIDDLWLSAHLLGGPIPAAGRGIGAVTLSGGYAVVLGDRLSEAGLPVADLSATTKERLKAEAGQPRPANPFDAGARPNVGQETGDLAAALAAMEDEPAVGAVYYGEMTWLGMEAAAEPLVAFHRRSAKPFLVGWQAGEVARPVRERLAEAGVPATDSPATAFRALSRLYAYARLPALPVRAQPAEADLSDLPGGVLDEARALALLGGAGVPLVEQAFVPRGGDLAAAAQRLGWPVVLKGVAPGLAHRTEEGLVRLALRDGAALGAAAAEMDRPGLTGWRLQRMVAGGIEMMVGVTVDPDAGPAVALGFGGILAEAMGPPAIEAAPLDEALAQDLIARTDPKGVLDGWRGGPAMDRAALARLLVAVGDFAWAARGRLRELDLNPVIVWPAGAVAVDALMVLQESR